MGDARHERATAVLGGGGNKQERRPEEGEGHWEGDDAADEQLG